MHSILLPALFAGVSLVTASPISPRNLDAPTCVVDDLLSLFRANAGSAKPFCRTYLNYVSTSTVETVTPPAVTIVATETRTSTHLETVTETDTDTIFTTIAETFVVETQTITATSEPSVPSTTSELPSVPSDVKLRRQLAAVSDYPAASVSSACSCLNIRRCGRQGTTTLAAATETVTSTVVIDATETSTTTDIAATTVQTTEPSLATATTLVTATPTTPPSVRLVATTASGDTAYLKAGPGNTGLVLFWTDDADDATDTFQLDSQGRLSFISADYDGQRVYSFLSTSWWVSDTNLQNVLFNTPEYIAGSQDLYAAQWVADSDTGNLSVANGPATLYMLLCYGAVLGMGTNILEFSTKIPHLGGIYDPSCAVVDTLSLEMVRS